MSSISVTDKKLFEKLSRRIDFGSKQSDLFSYLPYGRVAGAMNNMNAVGDQPWGNYRVRVNEVERQIGYDLLEIWL